MEDDYIDSSVVDFADYLKLYIKQEYPNAVFTLTHPQPWRLGWDILLRQSNGQEIMGDVRKALQKELDQWVMQLYIDRGVLIECTFVWN